jgi:hypothetical protein
MASKGSTRTRASSRQAPIKRKVSPSRRRASSVRAIGSTSQTWLTFRGLFGSTRPREREQSHHREWVAQCGAKPALRARWQRKRGVLAFVREKCDGTFGARDAEHEESFVGKCDSTTPARSYTAPAGYQWISVVGCQSRSDASTTVTVRVEKGNVLDILDIRILNEHVSDGC